MRKILPSVLALVVALAAVTSEQSEPRSMVCDTEPVNVPAPAGEATNVTENAFMTVLIMLHVALSLTVTEDTDDPALASNITGAVYSSAPPPSSYVILPSSSHHTTSAVVDVTVTSLPACSTVTPSSTRLRNEFCLSFLVASPVDMYASPYSGST